MFSTLSPTDAAASTMLTMMGGEFNLCGFFVLTSCWLNCFSFLVPNLFFFVLQEPSLLSFSFICPFLVALLGPPQSPHQSLAVWSLEQLALAKLFLHCWPLTDWPSAHTSLDHLPLDHLPLAKWPTWLLLLSPVMSFSSLLKSTSISPSISVTITR